MSTTRYYFTRKADKEDYGPGPWQGEPDKVQWTDESTSLPCLVVRGPTGALCGYVGVEKGHPLFGVDFHSAPGELHEAAHAGLTFSDLCMEGGEEDLVCHIPEPGQSDTVWWFGFDCGHMGDCVPRTRQLTRMLGTPSFKDYCAQLGGPEPPEWMDDENPVNYKPLAYVREVTTRLAAAVNAWAVAHA